MKKPGSTSGSTAGSGQPKHSRQPPVEPAYTAPSPVPGNRGASLSSQIAEHSVFRGIAPQYIDLLAEVAMLKEFESGEMVFREGDPANRFYLIIKGEIAIECKNGNGQVILEKIGPDDVLGWSWLFPPFYWRFDARATQPTKAIFFYGTWLRENCERDHEFGYEMLTRFVPVVMQRLQAARKQMVHGGK
jgi:CRP/FNR family transcriptional regulator, cyclic AMP receptor protein